MGLTTSPPINQLSRVSTKLCTTELPFRVHQMKSWHNTGSQLVLNFHMTYPNTAREKSLLVNPLNSPIKGVDDTIDH